jgi:polyribonucleotide nucleotidyltransferase
MVCLAQESYKGMRSQYLIILALLQRHLIYSISDFCVATIWVKNCSNSFVSFLKDADSLVVKSSLLQNQVERNSKKANFNQKKWRHLVYIEERTRISISEMKQMMYICNSTNNR